MNKLQKVLVVLEEQDLLSHSRESRLGDGVGYALDLDAVLDPTPEQAAQLEYWLDQMEQNFEHTDFEGEGLWENEGHDGSGTLTLAWYQQLSYYRDQAGIYITDYGIWKYASAIRRGEGLSIGGNPPLFHYPDPSKVPAYLCIGIAIEILLLHETFHHDVEWFTLKLSTIHAEHYLYKKYDELVYNQSHKLEEALASARMQTGLTTAPNRARFDYILKQVLDYLVWRNPSQPEGYRNANFYNSAKTHTHGRRVLAASLNQLNPSPKITPLGATLNIGKGLLSDYFRENFILVPIAYLKGTVTPPKSMALSIPSRDIRRILAKKGFQKSELGKGSHEVWTHDTRPRVTLPARKEFEGFQVLTNIRDSLGFESLHDLKEAAKHA